MFITLAVAGGLIVLPVIALLAILYVIKNCGECDD
jgi:hypothetical protein